MKTVITNNNQLAIQSKMVTLASITEENLFFNIPIYQRLYVWGSDQINTLLEDLFRSFEDNEDYYLGGIMITKNDNKYDLIDGQQRFTTLWLLGYLLKNDLGKFVYYIDKSNQIKRLSFAIRDFANHYFDNPTLTDSFTKDEQNELKPIVDAVGYIKEFLSNKNDEDKYQFAQYVYKRVMLIATEMPKGIDENRLFEVMNNRGVQLQHHEILKARLLEKLNDSDKFKYAKLWEASAIMDEYIEKNIKEVVGFTWKDLTFTNDGEEREVGLPNDILSKISFLHDKFDEKHLLEVLRSDVTIKDNKDKDDLDYDSGKIRSIISFPMLLLHTLRVYLFKRKKEKRRDTIEINEILVDNIEINEKKLLKIFKDSFEPLFYTEEGVKSFIALLWDIRVKFDTHVIKWVQIENNKEEEHHLIQRLYLNKDSLQRRAIDSNEGFALLQSMLYHSQQIITHYWLTPFLLKMLETDNKEDLYVYLKKLDNMMFCSNISTPLRIRSWDLMGSILTDFEPNISILSEHLGTRYWSYWFYKLEFILWHELSDLKGNDWKNYRMTKKNSVEHISPQNPKEYDVNKVWEESDDEEMKRQKLDDFGNLVLLSVGMNSEYSNKTFNAKRTDFSDKKRMDSLKSSLIFENDYWNWEICEKHREEMINYFNQYFQKTQ